MRAIFGVFGHEVLVFICLRVWIKRNVFEIKRRGTVNDQLDDYHPPHQISNTAMNNTQIDKVHPDQPPSDVSRPQSYSHRVAGSHASFTFHSPRPLASPPTLQLLFYPSYLLICTHREIDAAWRFPSSPSGQHASRGEKKKKRSCSSDLERWVVWSCSQRCSCARILIPVRAPEGLPVSVPSQRSGLPRSGISVGIGQWDGGWDRELIPTVTGSLGVFNCASQVLENEKHLVTSLT